MEFVPALDVQEWMGNKEIIKTVVHFTNMFAMELQRY